MLTLSEFADIMASVLTAKGTKAKATKLSLNLSTLPAHEAEEAKRVFHYMLDPQHTFGITWKAMQKHSGTPHIGEEQEPLCDLFCILDRLQLRKLSGHAALQEVYNFCDTLDLKSQDVVKWILDGKNPAKIGKAMINAMFPEYIYHQPYMGAKPDNPTNRSKLHWRDGVIVQKKYDGLCGISDMDNLRTRKGMIMNVPTDCKLGKELRALHIYKLWHVLQGELLCYKDGKALPRAYSNGVYSKLRAGSELTQEEADSLTYVVWDMVASSEYNNDQKRTKNVVEYEDRLSALERVVEFGEFSQIIIAEGGVYYNQTAAQMWCDKLVKQGDEGCVAKQRNAVFTDGKPWFQVKMKPDYECEMEIVGITEHNEQPDWIGALMLRSKCGLIVNNCGTGFTEAQRVYLYDLWHTGRLKGKIGTFKFNELIKPSKKKATYALGNPCVFKELRTKAFADTLEDVKEMLPCNGKS